MALAWKPFLLVPLMIEQGMPQGPFLAYPRRMDYMWRDIERRAAEHGSQTDEARRRGLFGSPSFTVGTELFWGDDRLEQAIAWAQAH